MTERDIFLTALEITDSTARKAYLDKACGGNAVMRSAVEALFASHDRAGSFLNTPIAQTPGTTSSADTKVDDPGDSSSAAVDQTIHFVPGQAADMDDDDDDTANGIPPGYLSPSKRPDSLGRLGHYEVLKVLGKGAFGTVLKAFDEKLHRMVAIKVMSIELASTSPARKRFLREARASAAIRHDNVVAIYAVEEQPIPYLVMEYIPGRTLADTLIHNGPLELNDALRLGQQIASGLAAAHSKGLIHRDIKPANILLEEGIQWKVKITDFGLARAADDASVTQSGMIAGTPMFMSPEQAQSNNIDQRSDLFSLGSVMYQMVSGRPPFRAASTLAILKRVTEDVPRPIQEIIPEVPDWFVTVISRLHEKKADDRYQTAQEVADLLGRCQSELQHAGKVTFVQSSRLAPRDEPNVAVSLRQDEPSTAAQPSSSRPSPDLNTSPPAIAQSSATLQGSSRRSETATFKRPLLFAVFLAVAAIIAVGVINRDKSTPDLALRDPQPTDPASEISNLKFEIPAAPAWHGWPADAPPAAIAPFNAEQAKQHQEAWAKYLNVPVEYSNSIGMKFRLIPPGEFTMGSTEEEIEWTLGRIDRNDEHWVKCVRSEAPQHLVRLTSPFYLGRSEVTQSQFTTVDIAQPMRRHEPLAGALPEFDNPSAVLPIERVSWTDSAQFCSQLSKQELLTPYYIFPDLCRIVPDGNGYRLPTEAEWEFACRAGTSTFFWCGNNEVELMDAAYCHENSMGQINSIEQQLANPFGIFDLHGNVSEWVEDVFDYESYTRHTDGVLSSPVHHAFDIPRRVTRGGSSMDSAPRCRSGYRPAYGPLDRNQFVGIRVALPIDAVRTLLKLTGPAIPKSQTTDLSMTVSASENSDSN